MAASCQTGEANDPTERCEGPAAIPVASETAATEARGWQSAREAREGRGPDPSGDASALGTQSKAARHPGVAQATIARKTKRYGLGG